MLFLLRQIRRKLLTENKVTTYLLYAVGEIILVMIGILLAVQIDDWNEYKNARAKEKEYLGRIVENLVQDSLMIENRIIFYKVVQNYGLNTLAYLEDDEIRGISHEELLISSFHAGQIMTLIFTSPTYEELKSAGELNLIQDVSLRNEMDAYYAHSLSDINTTLGNKPQYRERIRSILPYNLQEFLWTNCQRFTALYQELMYCKLPLEEQEVIEILIHLKQDEELLENLRFWMSSLKIGLKLMEKTRYDNSILIQNIKRTASKI